MITPVVKQANLQPVIVMKQPSSIVGQNDALTSLNIAKIRLAVESETKVLKSLLLLIKRRGTIPYCNDYTMMMCRLLPWAIVMFFAICKQLHVIRLTHAFSLLTIEIVNPANTKNCRKKQFGEIDCKNSISTGKILGRIRSRN